MDLKTELIAFINWWKDQRIYAPPELRDVNEYLTLKAIMDDIKKESGKS